MGNFIFTIGDRLTLIYSGFYVYFGAWRGNWGVTFLLK